MDPVTEDRSSPMEENFSKEETSLRLQEQANEKAALLRMNTIDQSPDPLEAIDATFRIPLLRDPINQEDPTKRKIDFSVRVGSSMARTEDSVVRIIEKQFGYSDDSTANSESTNDTNCLTVQKDRREKISPRQWTRRRRDSRKGSLQITPPRSYITEETPFAHFQRVARAVLQMTSICNTLNRLVPKDDYRMLSAVQMYLNLQEDVNKLLAFNPLNFTVVMPSKKKDKLPQLLQIPPNERTARDIKMILAYVRGHSSIHDYPADVQIHMCKCMLYQKFEERRILLKQGHPPTAFYFVVSGTLFVNIEDVNPNTGTKFTRTVSELSAGDCFGELALLERSTRSATIICKTTVELLVVFKEDFDFVVRQPLIRQRLSHIQFCQSLVLFEDFPCQVFGTQADDFFFQYIPPEESNIDLRRIIDPRKAILTSDFVLCQYCFPRVNKNSEDTVIVHDSRECRYLIVVKNGLCTLVAPFSESALNMKSDRFNETNKAMEQAFPYYVAMRKVKGNLKRPKTGSALERTASDFRDSLDVGLLTGVVDKEKLEGGIGPKRGQRPNDKSEGKENTKRPKPPLLKSRTMSNFYDSVELDRMKSVDESGDDTENPFWAVRLKGPTFREMMNKRRSAGKSHGKAANNMEKLEFLKETNKRGFAQVAELKQGAVFGLESLVHRPASSLSLVSHGAECLFISKKLFLKEANIKTLRVVSDMVMSYPSQVFIREHVGIHRDWINYKRGLVSEVLSRSTGS